jgi:hypothetical protein
MATKTSLTTAIANAITVVITRAKLLLGLAELVNEVYPTVLVDTNSATPNVITKTGNDYVYSIRFSKQGRNIAVHGTISNDTLSILDSTTFAIITNSDFATSPSANIIATAPSGATIRIQFAGTNVSYIGVMSPRVTYYFNGTFNAQN